MTNRRLRSSFYGICVGVTEGVTWHELFAQGAWSLLLVPFKVDQIQVAVNRPQHYQLDKIRKTTDMTHQLHLNMRGRKLLS